MGRSSTASTFHARGLAQNAFSALRASTFDLLDRSAAQIGKGGDHLMPMFIEREELEEKGEQIEKHRAEILKARYLDRITAFPEVRKLFERILTDGKKIALASSAKKDELAKYKEIARIDDLIHAQTSSDDAESSKPDPDIFEAAIRQIGDVPASEIIVVGDTPYDAEAAAKAGMRTIGLLCGGFPEPALLKAGCIAIYDGPGDLLANYDRSPLAGVAGAG